MHIKRLPLLLFILLSSSKISMAQQACIFKDTLFRIDFGTNRSVQEFNLRSLRSYDRSRTDCPPDGYYSYSSETSNCFNGDWITLNEDHTPNDVGGKMFFVNANPDPAPFFLTNLSGFKPNTTYEFGVWMLNLCRINGGCTPLPPNILVSLETTSGQRVAAFKTGQITSSANPSWKKYFATFTTPADGMALTLKMEDQTNGGCGNDFAMDDITFRECYKPDPPITQTEVKPAAKPAPVLPKPVAKVEKPEKDLKRDAITVNKIPVNDTVALPKKVNKIKPVSIDLPAVILTRENPVIKKILTEPATMLIELYDNGQVDGDTVSIYHNNVLIVSRAGISEKPVSFKIKIDAGNPHHELIMVADNLGSIPPNTSLMILTSNKKRYEVFISSSEQKNAKLLIDLQP